MVVLLVLINAKIQIIFATAKYFQYIIPASLPFSDVEKE